MFDFLFKRSANKRSSQQAALSAQVLAAKQQEQAQVQEQSASRRAEQLARAKGLVGDEAGAVALILSSEFADARLAAAEHVHSQAALEQVRQAMRNTDRRVSKLVQGRLDLLRHEQAEQQRAQAAVDTATTLLADPKLSPNQVAELDRSWLTIKAGPQPAEQFTRLREELGRRLLAQVQLQREVIDTVSELRRLSGSLGTVTQDAGSAIEAEVNAQAEAVARLAQACAAQRDHAEHASLPKGLLVELTQAQAEAGAQASAALTLFAAQRAAVDARQAALAAWAEADIASLDAKQLKREWQTLPAVREQEKAAALNQEFAALLARFPQPVAVEAAPQAAVAAQPNSDEAADGGAAPGKGGSEARQPKQSREVSPQFLEALDGLEAALQQGLLQVASEHDKTLRDKAGAGKLSPAQAERLAAARAEFKRLADWARWGGNVSREELVKAAEDLAAQQLAPNELAKKVGSLRERWKSLDTLSGHAPKALWERFDAACSLAYAPAAAHFRQLAEERQNNAAKAAELIVEAVRLATAVEGGEGGEGSAAPDLKQLAADSQRLRQAWSRLGTIDRKEKKRLDGEFAAVWERLSAPLSRQREIEIARREQLIAEVGQLKPMERNTVDMLRVLQEKWQEQARALPLDRRVEQALWQRFRAACDEIFAKRKESASAADQERRANLHAMEAVCAGLEAAAAQAGENEGQGSDERRKAAIAAALREARDAWHAIGPAPRASEQKIEERFQAAQAALQAQADAIGRRADAALANALRDKLRLCQELEARLASVDAAAGAPSGEWAARWTVLPALAALHEKVLHGRFAAALAALTGPEQARREYAAQLEENRAALRSEVLRLEIVAGIDSGAEFARERLQMQVEVLQSSLKSGQKPASQAAQLSALCSLAALADARTVSRIEVLLRRLGATEAQ
jgi:hypothetical protein